MTDKEILFSFYKNQGSLDPKIFDYVAKELKDGMALIDTADKIITVFGSARTKQTDANYQKAVNLGRLLGEQGFAVMTGGGPGIMEAAVKGAFEAGYKTYGINIKLPEEQAANDYTTVSYSCYNIFIRKALLTAVASGFVIMPGGFGTLDEFFEVLTLVKTCTIKNVPVVLMDNNFWNSIISFFHDELVFNDLISVQEAGLIKVCDDVESAVKYLMR